MESLLPKEPEIVDMSKVNEDLEKIVFDLSPDTSRGKLVITIHGNKGSGKTTAGYIITTGRIGGFPSGKTNVISFDNKSKITADQYFPNDGITVWNGKIHYREDPALCTKSGMISYKYIQKLIQSWKASPPDWILFDGFTIMAVILEMAMRFKHNLQPSEGIANRNVWKDRARFVQDLHNLAARTAKYGVMYTTYSEKNEIVDAGTVISKTDVPKYTDIVMQETDVVLQATKALGKDRDLFYIRVESTKFRQYVDMEGKPISIVPTTLSQGRTFDISKLAEITPPKVVPQKPSAVMEQLMKPPEKQVVIEQKPIEKQTIVEPKVETPTVKIAEPKPEEVKKIIPDVKVIEKPKVPEQKPKFVVPNLMDL
jgi:hypothetical protein